MPRVKSDTLSLISGTQSRSGTDQLSTQNEITVKSIVSHCMSL